MRDFIYRDDNLSHLELVPENVWEKLLKYTAQSHGLWASRQALHITKSFYSPVHWTRQIIRKDKREKLLNELGLDSSEKRIEYFRKELEKKRISFLEDSITLVISRNNVLEDTINQIRSTDGFDLHKEIKIFFVDEEAQDAGGVFKEWIFLIIQRLFSENVKLKKHQESEDMITLQKNRSVVKIQKERSKFKHSLKDDEEDAKDVPDDLSMVSDDILRQNNHKYNREESKGKRSSSEEVIADHKNYIEEEFVSSPYMKGIKINDNFGKKTKTEYFYEFGEEITPELANLLGKVIGKAIFEDVPISPRLNQFLYKCMMGQDFELDDLKTYDVGILSSVSYIMNNDFKTEDLGLTFGFIDTKKYSDDIQVTNNNKQVFLELLLNYYGYQKSMKVTNEFLKGLYSVVPLELINILETEDLEQMLIGATEIKLHDWEFNTQYRNRNIYNDDMVAWFWNVMHTLNQEQLRKFLQFATGWQSIPIDGFASLKNNRQEPWPFTIDLQNKNNGMIRAHTWFNRIELPLFKAKDELQACIKYILSQDEFIFDFE